MMNSITFVGEIADEHFKNWQKGGKAFYLNIKGNNAMLHTTECLHLGDAEGMNSATNHKICSANSQDLEMWAKNIDKKFQVCSDCSK